MEGEIFVVTIVAIVCATGLIKAWINRNNHSQEEVDEESFNRLAKAFMQHKKEMQERVQNLEAIVAEEDEEHKKSYQQIEASHNEGNLTNDLQQKDKVRS
jgi:hypothetical protein